MIVTCKHIGKATLFNGDCYQLMDGIKADALISDPPYGMNADRTYFEIACQRIENAQRQSSIFP